MSDQLLLALKAGFVLLLFLFVWRVLRIQARDLRAVPETGSATEITSFRRGRGVPLGPRLVVLSSPVYPPGTLVRLDADVAFGRAAENDVVLEGDRTPRAATAPCSCATASASCATWAPPTAPLSAASLWPASTYCGQATSAHRRDRTALRGVGVRIADFAIATHAGRVRRKNEDAYYAEPPLFAVADGMGGALAGELASRISVQTLGRARRGRQRRGAPGSHRAPCQPARRRAGDLRSPRLGDGLDRHGGAGGPEVVVFAHVGDSRAYLWRAGR